MGVINHLVWFHPTFPWDDDAPRHLASLDGAAGEAWCSDSGTRPARRMAPGMAPRGPGMALGLPHFQTPGMGWVKRKGPPKKSGMVNAHKISKSRFSMPGKNTMNCGLLNNSTITNLWFCQVFNALTHQIHKISFARTWRVALGTSRGLLAGAAGGGCEGGREGDFWPNLGIFWGWLRDFW